MSEELLPAVVQDPPAPARAVVLWMHGLGADGHDFAPVPPELGLPEDLPVRFVFPHAPRIPVSLNMGLIMPAWFDISHLGGGAQDEKGIRRSDERIRALIAREVERGVPCERIALAGFSQGGSMALFTGLRHAERLAGIVALSCWLPLAEEVEREASEANRATRVFQAHGTHDPMVPLEAGLRTHEWLVAHGYPAEWHAYPMEHQVCLEEIREIGRFLGEVLRPEEE